MLYQPPSHVVREAAGLERFAAVMRADGWDRELILRLPDVDNGYWEVQAAAMRRLLAANLLRNGARLLDVGANTCWASNIFARRGLDVVAIDIAATELQGLRTADYFFDDGAFFERVLSTMFDLALADESFDYVFCCEVLHHNDRSELLQTMRELFRVLRPGGQLLVINEPLRFPLRLKRDHAREVAEYEGHEHVFFLHQYLRAARSAGFALRLPDLDAALRPGAPGLPQGGLAPLKRWLRAHRTGQRALAARRLARWAWRYGLRGDANLSFVGTKPGG